MEICRGDCPRSRRTTDGYAVDRENERDRSTNKRRRSESDSNEIPSSNLDDADTVDGAAFVPVSASASASAALPSGQSEDELALAVARVVKTRIDFEVGRYVESDDYRRMVEGLKRAQREDMLRAVEADVARERAILLEHSMHRMRTEVAEQVCAEQKEALAEARREAEALTPQEILLQNQLRIERQQQAALDERLAADRLRLEAVMAKKQQEREREILLEQQRKAEQEQRCAADTIAAASAGGGGLSTGSAGGGGAFGGGRTIAFGIKSSKKGLF